MKGTMRWKEKGIKNILAILRHAHVQYVVLLLTIIFQTI